MGEARRRTYGQSDYDYEETNEAHPDVCVPECREFGDV